jgi:hypothetical protein
VIFKRTSVLSTYVLHSDNLTTYGCPVSLSTVRLHVTAAGGVVALHVELRWTYFHLLLSLQSAAVHGYSLLNFYMHFLLIDLIILLLMPLQWPRHLRCGLSPSTRRLRSWTWGAFCVLPVFVLCRISRRPATAWSPLQWALSYQMHGAKSSFISQQ